MGDLTDLLAHSSTELGGFFRKVNAISLTVLSEREPESLEELRRKLLLAEEKCRAEEELKALIHAARALRRGDSTPVKELMQHRPMLNSLVNTRLPPSSATLLHVAAALGDFEICQLLVRHGARSLINGAGQTPSVVALLQGHRDVYFFCKGLELSDEGERSVKRSSPPMRAIELDNPPLPCPALLRACPKQGQRI